MIEITSFLQRQVPWELLPLSLLERVVQRMVVHFWPAGAHIVTDGLEGAAVEGALQIPNMALVVVRKGRFVVGLGQRERRFGPGSTWQRWREPAAAAEATISAERLSVEEDCIAYILSVSAFQALTQETAFSRIWLEPFCEQWQEFDRPHLARSSVQPYGDRGSDKGQKVYVGTPIRFEVLSDDLPIREALDLRRRLATEVLLLHHEGWKLLSDREIAAWVQEDALPDHAPVSSIMSKAPQIRIEQGLMDAALELADPRVAHLVQVLKERPVAVLSRESVLLATKGSVARIALRLANRRGTGELQVNLDELTLLDDLELHEANGLARWLHDQTMVRSIEEYQRRAGPAPARFAFLAVGEAARCELIPDLRQEHVLVYGENVGTEGQRWFQKLATAVADGLELHGFVRQESACLATQPSWTKPLSTWRGYIRGWAGRPGGEVLENIRPFFDVRCVYGTLTEYRVLAEELRTLAEGSGLRRKRLEELLVLAARAREMARQLQTGEQAGVPLTDLGSLIRKAVTEVADLACGTAPPAVSHTSATIGRLRSEEAEGILSVPLALDLRAAFTWAASLPAAMAAAEKEMESAMGTGGPTWFKKWAHYRFQQILAVLEEALDRLQAKLDSEAGR